MATLKKQIDAITFTAGPMTNAKDESESGTTAMLWYPGKPKHNADEYANMMQTVRTYHLAEKGSRKIGNKDWNFLW